MEVREKEGHLDQRVTQDLLEVKVYGEPSEERVPRVHQAYREQMAKREKWEEKELLVILDQQDRVAGRAVKVALDRTEDLD